MILLIDNYDSFTYNVVQSLAKYTRQEIKVVRSREITLEECIKLQPDSLVLSPGPGRPEDAGVTVDAIRYFSGKVPILGVCLGHQAIGYAFGAKIIGAKFIKHGIAEEIKLDGKGLFRSIGNKAVFTRYHSLVIDESTLPPDFEVTARSEDGDIMGIRHKTMIIEGVQFHPESIASQCEKQFFNAFLNYRREALPVQQILNTLFAGKDLDQKTAELFMEDLTDGCLDERQTSAILASLSAKGPSAEEIAGCASVLCRKKTPLDIGTKELTDIVGTGGDSKGSFNISSMAALIASSCGLAVAKHGNRAVSSKSGSADFYEALGIKIDNNPAKSAQSIKNTNFGFLFAPVYHSAMRFAAPVRKALGIKTIMNLIGPLSNPAGAAYQMLGVYDESLLEPVGRASKLLGSKRVMVVVSEDGFDEISPCYKTSVFEIDENGKEKKYTINPADYGFSPCNDNDLAGGTPAENAMLALELLEGRSSSAIKYAVCLNAGAALYIGKQASSIEEGYKKALIALENGDVKKKLEQIKADTNGIITAA